MIVLKPEPLTAAGFAPYGDVIATSGGVAEPMNEARFERFDRLAVADADGDVTISIVRSKSGTALPYRIEMVERHPLGSQAFVPLEPFRFIVVVAPPGESVESVDLHAFVTNGRQGINYHRGTWHMPLIALGERQPFLVVDRGGADNCEQRVLEAFVMLTASEGP